MPIHLHKNIRKKRKMLGMTQSEVANLINISPQLYWNKENGVRRFTALEVYEIAKVFQVDMNTFFIEEVEDDE